MNEITKCLNEWNATIEALGQGSFNKNWSIQQIPHLDT